MGEEFEVCSDILVKLFGCPYFINSSNPILFLYGTEDGRAWIDYSSIWNCHS